MTKQELLGGIKNKLIVSCQALPGEPLYVEERSIMYLMARAAKEAGACAIRTNSIRDVIAIRQETGLPVIGLIKKHYEGYDGYITPTMREVDELMEAGSDIVASDMTFQRRGDGVSPGEFLRSIKEKYPQIVLMADISTYEEGVNAWKCGADLISTTMSGYTPYSPQIEEPDYTLIERLSGEVSVPVIAEGRLHTPEQAAEALRRGAYAVVVGGAITRPKEIAGRFVRALSSEGGRR